MLGLSRRTVTGLIDAGFVAPLRGPRNAYRFSFQDLMLLRTAFTLQQARIAPRKILRSLAKLKADLPQELPLTGLRITAVGADVAVRDRSGQWQADTGQWLMDFELVPVGAQVSMLSKAPGTLHAPPAAPVAAASSPDWFGHAQSLEASDPLAAEAAYRQAITSDPGQPGPYLNLGAMLCESGRCDEAVELYERAVATVGDDPLIHFNHAIALEDQQRPDRAATAYGRALELDGQFADAHYNLGMLLERQGDGKGALRHFNAYRRLQRAQTP
jgi:tetratricopeptide (TPR) repeat protein